MGKHKDRIDAEDDSRDEPRTKGGNGTSAGTATAEPVAAVAAAPAELPDISSLAQCVEEVRQAALDGDAGPEEPTDFHQLRGRLEAARDKFPPLYGEEVVRPFIAALDKLGAAGFTQVLLQDPRRERTAGLMLDIAQAILQRGERFQIRATNAFQEVVSDLYDGFLSSEDRRGVKPPDQGTTPPLVKWGNPDFGPYTWPVDAAASFGLRAGIVSLPPANARRGLLAWSALGHETGGHDILHADTGLEEELAEAVRLALSGSPANLDEYWSERIDETASDVLGILNMGPAAGIGLIGYFRGLNKAFTGDGVLRGSGPADDPHPADVLRGYLAAETVALLRFRLRNQWADIIAAETDKDAQAQDIEVAGTVISRDVARQSARAVAKALVTHRADSLEQHALGEIQNWRNADERKVRIVRQILTTAGDLSGEEGGIFAAHVVAAAVVEALSNGADIPVVFDRMVGVLDRMHTENPAWGPLFVRHRGDIARDVAYIPSRRIVAQRQTTMRDIRDVQVASKR